MACGERLLGGVRGWEGDGEGELWKIRLSKEDRNERVQCCLGEYD